MIPLLGCSPELRDAMPLTCAAALDPLGVLVSWVTVLALGVVLLIAVFEAGRWIVRRLWGPRFEDCWLCGEAFFEDALPEGADSPADALQDHFERIHGFRS